MINDTHIKFVVQVSYLLLSVVLIVLFAGGCASQDHNRYKVSTKYDRSRHDSTTPTSNSFQNNNPVSIWGAEGSYSQNHPGLLFPSDSMISLVEKYPGDLSYIFDYGIYGRHDYLLGVYDGSEDDIVYSDAVVTDDETVYESNGRTLVFGSRRVRSTKVRRSR